MGKIIKTPLPHDLPENWNDTQFVSPNGTEVGLSEQHGYNYLMKQVNATQKAIMELDEGSAPYGNVEDQISVKSAAELDSRLDGVLSTMSRPAVRYILVEFTEAHPVLGGGARIFRIDKIWDNYCVVQALGYVQEGAGAVSEFFRSKLDGVWASWVRTYNTLFKPTTVEIGAAPAGFGLGETRANTGVVDANLIIRTGFYGCNINTPDGGWWYGIHVQYAPDYAWQQFSKTNDTVTVERKCYNGVWTEWKSLSTGTVIPATVEE